VPLSDVIIIILFVHMIHTYIQLQKYSKHTTQTTELI